jgi:hypothetical protein
MPWNNPRVLITPNSATAPIPSGPHLAPKNRLMAKSIKPRNVNEYTQLAIPNPSRNLLRCSRCGLAAPQSSQRRAAFSRSSARCRRLGTSTRSLKR